MECNSILSLIDRVRERRRTVNNAACAVVAGPLSASTQAIAEQKRSKKFTLLRGQKTSVQERSSQTRAPVCKTVPADLRKIPTQCGDIGVGADAVEPFEHERRILALLASRGDWDFLIVDRAADGVREDFRLLLAG